MMSHSDSICVALLGLSEEFRLAGKYKMAIKCVMAMFKIPMSGEMSVLGHLNLGKLLFYYTKNVHMAQANLERAYTLCQAMNGMDEMRVQIASLLSDLYAQLRLTDLAKNILQQELEASRLFPFWHCQMCFQFAALLSHDSATASSVLEMGAQVASHCHMVYNEALFRLTKAMLVVVDLQRRGELHALLERVQGLIASLPANHPRISHLKAFFFLLQLVYFLSTGALKGARPCLRQLQGVVQELAATPDNAPPLEPTQFQWLSKDALTVLTYIVTLTHAVQCGQMDRVLKYRERALLLIARLRQLTPTSTVRLHLVNAMLNNFEMLLRENSSMCRIVMGQPASALEEIDAMVTLVRTHNDLLAPFEAQIHTLLGFYAIMMRSPQDAEAQFKSALRAVTDVDLWTTVNLNLAIVFLQSSRDEEFYGILERITPERLQSGSGASTLLAAAHFVRALQSFFQSRHQEAKMHLKDCLALSNHNDMLRLSACALILLGRIFLASGSIQECIQMLAPGSDMARKVPDVPLQAWATAMLHEVYSQHHNSNQANEFKQIAEEHAERIDQQRTAARQSNANRLIAWTEGLPPVV